MLDVKNIHVSYGDAQALWDVSLAVSRDEIITLVGSNGSGKSTTLKAISGLVPLSSGEIRFEKTRIDRLHAYRIVEMGIAHVPEGRRLWPGLSVRENLELGAYIRTARNVKKETMEWVFKLFPRLEERISQLAGTLSGGEQQMLAIGRGLLSKPKLLILDEPSLGLAPLLVDEVLETIQKINRQGVTILLIEQNVTRALSLSTRCYVLELGRIVLSGTGQDLLADERVKAAYLGL
ncbi:MAG: branched-chain amino acid ABC transporter ATP-binding protein [Deltaproteobacteria bacterium RBG_16_49_23]|nr:MAG: branched-chain amino acid ABC transporter ATP-binding protein [Deltaproteobacteria bacterium RBG_16_49_23]